MVVSAGFGVVGVVGDVLEIGQGRVGIVQGFDFVGAVDLVRILSRGDQFVDNGNDRDASKEGVGIDPRTAFGPEPAL